METKKPSRYIATILLTVFGVAALATAVGIVLVSNGDEDAASAAANETALSAAAQPYQQDLEHAAQQCPTVLTAQRLDRYIADSTGWDANYESPAVEIVSVAGMTEEVWESIGGGDPNDVPTAIGNVADLWCGYSTTLAGEDIDLDYELPAPADDDDDPRAAALGLAAILMGTDTVRSGNISISNVSTVEQSMNAVL